MHRAAALNKQTPESVYAAVAGDLMKSADVTLASAEKRRFGSGALHVNHQIFAMLSSKNEFVVKLPKARVDALVASGCGRRFDAGRGRPMKEWFVAGPGTEADWIAFAKEAMAFVAGRSEPSPRSR